MAGLCNSERQSDPQFDRILAQGLLARRVAGSSALRLLRIDTMKKSNRRDQRYLPCSNATNLVNSLPEVSFLAVVPASEVSITFVIAWGRKGRRINCPP